jgi:hypothetical protein
MTATLERPSRLETPDPVVTTVSVADRPPLRITLSREVARELGRYVSAIADTVRDAEEKPRELDIDLSEAVELPQAQLVLLVNLVRAIVGDGTTITLSGVRPMNVGSLVAFGLPGDVVVIDSRGRRWAGAR